MIRIRQKVVIRAGIIIAAMVMGIMLVSVVMEKIEDYRIYSRETARASHIRMEPNRFIGRRTAARGFLRYVGDSCTLDGVILCGDDACGCPITYREGYINQLPDAYEIAATVRWCADDDREVCFVEVTKLYRLVGAGENLLVRGTEIAVTPSR